MGEWVGWALGAAAAFGIVAVAAVAFEWVDWLPGSIEEAVAPATAPSFGEAAPPLLALALLLALPGSPSGASSPRRRTWATPSRAQRRSP